MYVLYIFYRFRSTNCDPFEYVAKNELPLSPEQVVVQNRSLFKF